MHPTKRLLRNLLVAWSPGLLALLLAATSVGAQANQQRAGLVVQYGDGRVETACVAFDEPELDGLELLERSGLPVVVQAGGVGSAVCKIGPEGCDYPAESCFCRREGARSIYWAFYTLDGGAWAYASLGATGVQARDGDVHGWAWGLGESGEGAVPPVLDHAAVCGPPAAAPSPPPPARATPPPAATAAPAGAAPQAQAPTSPTGAPATIAAPTPAAPTEGGWGGYLGFGALVLVLGAGAAILARRR
ncbi:MAG TPA: hypothetical protein PKD53_09170 [Chloroflexaceae bacterium]|nr:hypothetical protein [Chloroflexaceae bacterium]